MHGRSTVYKWSKRERSLVKKGNKSIGLITRKLPNEAIILSIGQKGKIKKLIKTWADGCMLIETKIKACNGRALKVKIGIIDFDWYINQSLSTDNMYYIVGLAWGILSVIFFLYIPTFPPLIFLFVIARNLNYLLRLLISLDYCIFV